MAYLGKGLGSLTTANITVDKMTGNGSTATLAITLAQGVNSVNDISVFVSGVMQRPGTDYTLSGSTLTFTTAPANGLQVVAVSHGDSVLDCVADATAITASFDNNSVPDSAIGSLAASKLTGALAGAATNLTGLNAAQLTGALPAVAATNLTNLTSANLTGALPALSAANLTGITSYTKSANDPAKDTNPSGGTGSVWVNHTSGETYICTDATTDANVWTNVGSGDSNIEPWKFGGTVSGYAMGGHSNDGNTDAIVEFSLTSFSSATDTGNLSVGRHNTHGCQSDTKGYTCGGKNNSSVDTDIVDAFPFANPAAGATNVGALSVARHNPSGANSETNGYMAGGSGTGDMIDKFSFTSFTTANNIGTLSAGAMSGGHGHSSPTHGFASRHLVIEKYPFASDTGSTDIGALTSSSRGWGCGQSSETHGFVSGNEPVSSAIDKFSFASGGTAVGHGVLFHARTNPGSCSSLTEGYTIGGDGSQDNVIDKFSFSSNTTAADVGDLPFSMKYMAGCHD